MSTTIHTDTTSSMRLEDYLEYLRKELDVADLDDVLRSASHLRELANNRTFLAEWLSRELAHWRTFQRNNTFTAQSFILGAGLGFYLRANIWMPREDFAVSGDRIDRLFSYQIPHDHNFSFLTVGYWGPGYETTIYDHTRGSGDLDVGQTVELRFLERTSLPMGKVMFYQAFHDVHSQEPPAAFSISLNLVLPPPDRREQLFFDLGSSTITASSSPHTSSRVMLCQLAALIGDGRSAHILEELAVRHPCRYTRVAAYLSWAALAPSDDLRIWQYALGDSALAVQNIARSRLDPSR